MNDESVVLVEYTHRNRGQHGVYGPVTRTFYGHRGGGEQFLVDRRDIEAAPNLFKPLNNTRKVEELPVEPRAEAPAPPPAEPVKKAKPKVQEDVLKKQVEAKRLDLQSIPGVSEAIAKQFRQRGLATAQDLIDYGAEQMSENVTGVGASRAAAIVEYANKLAGNEEEE